MVAVRPIVYLDEDNGSILVDDGSKYIENRGFVRRLKTGIMIVSVISERGAEPYTIHNLSELHRGYRYKRRYRKVDDKPVVLLKHLSYYSEIEITGFNIDERNIGVLSEVFDYVKERIIPGALSATCKREHCVIDEYNVLLFEVHKGESVSGIMRAYMVLKDMRTTPARELSVVMKLYTRSPISVETITRLVKRGIVDRVSTQHSIPPVEGVIADKTLFVGRTFSTGYGRVFLGISSSDEMPYPMERHAVIINVSGSWYGYTTDTSMAGISIASFLGIDDKIEGEFYGLADTMKRIVPYPLPVPDNGEFIPVNSADSMYKYRVELFADKIVPSRFTRAFHVGYVRQCSLDTIRFEVNPQVSKTGIRVGLPHILNMLLHYIAYSFERIIPLNGTEGDAGQTVTTVARSKEFKPVKITRTNNGIQVDGNYVNENGDSIPATITYKMVKEENKIIHDIEVKSGRPSGFKLQVEHSTIKPTTAIGGAVLSVFLKDRRVAQRVSVQEALEYILSNRIPTDYP